MNCVGPNAPAHEPFSCSGSHVAAMQDFQRREKLVAEIGLPPADAGERRGRADHRAVAAERAVVRLHAPDRGDDVAVDAVGLLDLVEDRLVLASSSRPVCDARVVHQDVEIVPERLGELGLRVHQVHDPQVGREPGDVLVEARARDVALGGERPQAFEAGLRNWPRPARIAEACISGWPEEPDSPVHSRGGCVAGARCGSGAGGRRAAWRRGLTAAERAGRPACGTDADRWAQRKADAAASAATPQARSTIADAHAYRLIDSCRSPHWPLIIEPHWGKIWLSEG